MKFLSKITDMTGLKSLGVCESASFLPFNKSITCTWAYFKVLFMLNLDLSMLCISSFVYQSVAPKVFLLSNNRSEEQLISFHSEFLPLFSRDKVCVGYKTGHSQDPGEGI